MNTLEEISEVAWDSLRGRIGGTIVTGLHGLLEGAEEDIRTFGAYIAQDLVDAIQRRDTSWEKEIKAQAGLLMEINRLRAVNANHALLMQVIHALVRMGLEIAATFVKGFLTDAMKEMTS